LSHGLNHWLSTWGKDLVSPGSTGEGNSAVRPEGVEPGCTSLRPHLRADCHWGRISGWRCLPCGVFQWAWIIRDGWVFFLSYHATLFVIKPPVSPFHHADLSDCYTVERGSPYSHWIQPGRAELLQHHQCVWIEKPGQERRTFVWCLTVVFGQSNSQ